MGISISLPMTIRLNVVYLKIVFEAPKTFHTHTIRRELSQIHWKLTKRLIWKAKKNKILCAKVWDLMNDH